MKLFLVTLLMIANYSLLFSDDWEIMETNLNTELRDIELLSETNAIITGKNGCLLRSSYPFNNWDINKLNDNTLAAVSFANDQMGIICSLDENTLTSEIYKTIDGGENWNLLFDLPKYVTRTIKIIDDTTFAFVGLYFFPPSTFEITYLEIDQYGNEIKSNIISYGGIRFGCFKENEIWLPTINGELFKSTDKGDSWEKIQEFNTELRMIEFFDNAAFLLGPKYLYTSKDNGGTWQIVTLDLDISQYQLNNIYVNSDNKAYLFVENNKRTYIYSSDDMATWEKEFEAEIDIVDEKAVLNDSLIYIPAAEGKILKGRLDSEVSVKEASDYDQNFVCDLVNNELKFSGIPESFFKNVSLQLKIYDISGRKIYTGTIGSNRSHILENDLLPGVYLVKISNGKRTLQSKFIK